MHFALKRGKRRIRHSHCRLKKGVAGKWAYSIDHKTTATCVSMLAPNIEKQHHINRLDSLCECKSVCRKCSVSIISIYFVWFMRSCANAEKNEQAKRQNCTQVCYKKWPGFGFSFDWEVVTVMMICASCERSKRMELEIYGLLFRFFSSVLSVAVCWTATTAAMVVAIDCVPALLSCSMLFCLWHLLFYTLVIDI